MSKPSTKQKVKEAAESLLMKLVDSFDSKKAEDTPPKPPPKLSSDFVSSRPDNYSEAQNLVQSFNGLTVSEYPPPSQYSSSSANPGFIGGFHPAYLNGESPGRLPFFHASSAPPPTMPAPFSSSPPGKQSLTMQMALDPNMGLPPRPSSTPNINEAWNANPPKTPTKTKPVKSSPVQTPVKVTSTPSGSSSTPSTPSGKAGQVQCSGTTKAGKQCTRFVKAAPALDRVIDDDFGELNPPLERFCFQHTKELLGPSGCYSRKNGEWVEFNDWIPSYLQVETQLSLRIEMERARSSSDVDGYIYTFEIRDDETESVKLKVGRAVNLVKRIDQWGKQCGSKEQVLRGYYPGPESQGGAGNGASLMKGKVKAGEKAPCCHRLERLIHLELADLTTTCAYLDASWPAGDYSDRSTSGKGNTVAKRARCEDCGSMHKEIFEFQRWSEGGNKNQEWEKIVKPVIERWGMFVELYV